MAKDYAKSFYNSGRWKNARKLKKKSAGGLCELCLQRGLYNPGVVVHHITEITPENITDASITLNQNNFMLLCTECHNKIHHGGKYSSTSRRYKLNESGDVIEMIDK